MPKQLQQPCPMMARTAGFDRDHRRCKIRKERHHLLTPHLLSKNRYLGGVHSMKLENMLRRIHPNSANMIHGRPPLSEISNDLILARRCRRWPSTPTRLQAAWHHYAIRRSPYTERQCYR